MMNCPPLLAISNPDRTEHADFFWRLERPFVQLREHGVAADVCALGPDNLPTVPPVGRVVIIQRISIVGGSEDQIASWLDSFRKAGALAVVAELDDDTLSDAYLDWLDASGGLDLVRRQQLVAERAAWRLAVKHADAVTVSTEPLAEVVRRYTAAPVHVIPNAIDVPWFTERLVGRPSWADHLTIGWAGGRRPEADLAPMAAAWARIARQYPAVRFVVAGWQSDVIYRELDAVDAIDRIIRVPWQSLDGWPAAMQVDIGCCPLADTPFNRCKSPIKAWEYALAGAAVAVSPTVYEDCFADIGLMERYTDEWEAGLDLRIRSEQHRRYCVRSMAAHVQGEHSLSGGLHRWSDAYSQIAASAGVSV